MREGVRGDLVAGAHRFVEERALAPVAHRARDHEERGAHVVRGEEVEEVAHPRLEDAIIGARVPPSVPLVDLLRAIQIDVHGGSGNRRRARACRWVRRRGRGHRVRIQGMNVGERSLVARSADFGPESERCSGAPRGRKRNKRTRLEDDHLWFALHARQRGRGIAAAYRLHSRYRTGAPLQNLTLGWRRESLSRVARLAAVATVP